MRSNDIIPETLEDLKSGGGHLRKLGLPLNHLYVAPKSRGKGAIALLLSGSNGSVYYYSTARYRGG